jgi:hypothetical protein
MPIGFESNAIFFRSACRRIESNRVSEFGVQLLTTTSSFSAVKI